ncbi:hypothetical protein DFR28_101897 [Arenicella xantha]|uniref:Plasmid-related protein n=1 Tax=Arenicella xantha TaxID=644221 RepID=A0A395JPD6_9GAMM|nr:hypothetical protein DFR28_101897 [Arenicella xantha]
MNTTLDYLQNTYGPLLKMGSVAEVLGRSQEGLRVSLCKDDAVSRHLNSGKVRIGRRVYFKAMCIAELVDNGTPE